MNPIIPNEGEPLYRFPGPEVRIPIAFRKEKPMIMGSLQLPTDENPEAYFTFMFKTKKRIQVQGGEKDSVGDYFLIDELSAALSEGFMEKLKAFVENHCIERYLVEPGSNELFLRTVRKTTGMKRNEIDSLEAKDDNVNCTIDQWFAAKDETGSPIFYSKDEAILFMQDDVRAKRAARNLMIYYERLAGHIPRKAPKKIDRGIRSLGDVHAREEVREK